MFLNCGVGTQKKGDVQVSFWKQEEQNWMKDDMVEKTIQQVWWSDIPPSVVEWHSTECGQKAFHQLWWNDIPTTRPVQLHNSYQSHLTHCESSFENSEDIVNKNIAIFLHTQQVFLVRPAELQNHSAVPLN